MFDNYECKDFKLAYYYFYHKFKLIKIVFNKTRKDIQFIKKYL